MNVSNISPFRFLLLLLLLILASCKAQPAGEEAGVAEATATVVTLAVTQPTAATSIPLPSPTPPVSTPVPSATMRPTSTPPPLPIEEAAAAPAGKAFPDLVWLPFGSGSYGAPILTVRDGQVVYEPEPVAVEIFFDYTGSSGLLAYGGRFWEAAANGTDSVTDLWVYDYQTGEAEMWLPGNVSRAAWSPAAGGEGEPPLAVALHNGTGYDLVLMSGPGETQLVAADISPYYSWSPNGEQIAFVRHNQLFVVSAFDPEQASGPLTGGMYENSGWIGDAPLWLAGTDYLLYADAPFSLVSLDGTRRFTPAGPAGESLGPDRPLAMLWSADHRQLALEIEGMSGSHVQIYHFAPDLQSVTDVYRLEDSRLVGWFTPGESIVVLQNNEPLIWSLATQDFLKP